MAWRIRDGWCRDGNLERRLKAFAGVSTRTLGNMDKNIFLERALRRGGLKEKSWATGWQVHGRRVRHVVKPTAPGRFPATDGFVTRTDGLALCVRAADCVPVFIADPSSRALGLVHSGWRGTRKGILTAAVRRMQRLWKARPREMWISLGPHIRACCYEVGPEFIKLFKNRPGTICRKKGRTYLDLSRSLLAEAVRAGVPLNHVTVSPHCTGHDRRLFSYRRDKTANRMAAIFALK